MPFAVETQNLSHWTARVVPRLAGLGNQKANGLVWMKGRMFEGKGEGMERVRKKAATATLPTWKNVQIMFCPLWLR